MSVHRLAEYIFETRFSRKLEIRKERIDVIKRDIRKKVVHTSEDVLRTKDEFGS